MAIKTGDRVIVSLEGGLVTVHGVVKDIEEHAEFTAREMVMRNHAVVSGQQVTHTSVRGIGKLELEESEFEGLIPVEKLEKVC